MALYLHVKGVENGITFWDGAIMFSPLQPETGMKGTAPISKPIFLMNTEMFFTTSS